MNPVKKTAVSSLFAMLLAFPLAACTAEVTPNEPETTTVRTAPPPQGPGSGAADNARAVGTTGIHRGAQLTPGEPEPIPNPWKGGPDDGLPVGVLPQVDTAIPDLPSPHPILHKTVDDNDVTTYHGPSNDHSAW